MELSLDLGKGEWAVEEVDGGFKFIWQSNEQPESKSAIGSGPPGYIYVASGGGYHKIGRTCDVEARLSRLSASLPFTADLIYAARVRNVAWVESFLHETFADKRTNGEWFQLSEQDLLLIPRLCVEFRARVRGQA